MEMVYRFIFYIILANILYMIFTLFQKGYRHHYGYIAQLFFLFCLLIMLYARDFPLWLLFAVSVGGVFLLILLPAHYQKQIEILLMENNLGEIEHYARKKTILIWSEPNNHLYNLSLIAKEHFSNPDVLCDKLRAKLSVGEPFDSMTRLFIANIHFNNRKFHELIRDLTYENKPFNEYTDEELLFLVRAFLETSRYEEAILSQIALEKTLGHVTGPRLNKVLISRMISFAFLGLPQNFEKLISTKEELLNSLPISLIEFWRGASYFNFGNFELGEKIMSAVIADPEQTIPESLLIIMRKRYFGMLENKGFYGDKVLPQLSKLTEKYLPQLDDELDDKSQALADPEQRVTKILLWLVLIVSFVVMMYFDIDDVVNLIKIGANSSLLVSNGEYYRLFTYQFIHLGWFHLLMNLTALSLFAPTVETILGWQSFLGLYFFSGILGGLFAVYSGQPLSVGASASILGLLSAEILLRLFKARGIEKIKMSYNFSALVFLLVLNIAIGFIESGIDNSAHIGGLVAGAIFSALFFVISRYPLLKRLFSYLSLTLIIFVAGFSVHQLYKFGTVQYFDVSQPLYKITNSSSPTPCNMQIEIPLSWEQAESGDDSPWELEAVGPFNETLELLVDENTLPPEEYLKNIIEIKTREIEKSNDIIVKKRTQPLLVSGTTAIYKVIWLLETENGFVSSIDYFIFEDQLLFYARLVAGTKEYPIYEPLSDRMIQTFNFILQ